VRQAPSPSIKDLPGPHTVESVFKIAETERLYLDFYNGRNLVLSFMHVFQRPNPRPNPRPDDETLFNTPDDHENHLERGSPTLVVCVNEARHDGTLVELGSLLVFPIWKRNKHDGDGGDDDDKRRRHASANKF
jgi:hypothetical protein